MQNTLIKATLGSKKIKAFVHIIVVESKYSEHALSILKEQGYNILSEELTWQHINRIVRWDGNKWRMSFA